MRCRHDRIDGGVRVSDAIASHLTRRLHVSASTRDVVRAVLAMLRPEVRRAEHRPYRHALMNAALAQHRENLQLYARVMGGAL